MDVGYQLRSALTENLNLKLISVLFALILYSVVHGSQEAQRSIRLNVVALLPQTPNRVLMTNLPEISMRPSAAPGPRSTI